MILDTYSKLWSGLYKQNLLVVLTVERMFITNYPFC